MALTRLFVDAELAAGQTVRLDEEQARYLGRVLRLRPGDTLTAFSADSGEFAATVVSLGKSKAEIRLGDSVVNVAESPLKIHLVQGISRGDRMETVVQKATELGVKRISPVLTEYGVVKLSGSRASKRREHWQKIAESACEQCGRTRPPLVDEPLPLKTWLGDNPRESDVDLILKPNAARAMAALEAPTTKVCLLVGPEGGFSEMEYADADVAGFAPVSLGPRILRTETAAIAAVTLAAAFWGDLGERSGQ